MHHRVKPGRQRVERQVQVQDVLLVGDAAGDLEQQPSRLRKLAEAVLQLLRLIQRRLGLDGVRHACAVAVGVEDQDVGRTVGVRVRDGLPVPVDAVAQSGCDGAADDQRQHDHGDREAQEGPSNPRASHRTTLTAARNRERSERVGPGSQRVSSSCMVDASEGKQ